MQVNTGHKGFDYLANRPTGYVGRGNVLSAAQLSTYVRSHNKTQMPDTVSHALPGKLQAFDMACFKRYDVPNRVAGVVRSAGEDADLIVYMFRTRDRKCRDWVRVQGWVITDTDHNVIHREYCNPQGRCIIDGMAAHLEAGQ